MNKFLIVLLLPLMIFPQDNALIGDVDCSGEVNSEDASLILQFITNVINELPCQDNMTGLTPEQLQAMINMMNEQLNINYSSPDNNYPIMISNQSDETFVFTDALDYCYDLDENGYNDWYMPSLDELTYAASGGIEFPDNKTDDYLWTRTMGHGATAYFTTIRLIALTYNSLQWDGGNNSGTSSTYVRCVRSGESASSEGLTNALSGSSVLGNSEQPITMIGPMYRYDDFSDFSNYAVAVNNDTDINGYLHYFDAVKFCAQLIYNEYDDWFLPSLAQIQDYIIQNPLNEIVIPNNNEGGKNFWAFMSFKNMNLMSDYDNYATTIHITGTDSSFPNQLFKIDDEWAEGYSRCFCVR